MHHVTHFRPTRNAMAHSALYKQQYKPQCISTGCRNSTWQEPSEETNPFPGRCEQCWKDLSARTSIVGPGQCWLCGSDATWPRRKIRTANDLRCGLCSHIGVPGHSTECIQSQAFIWRGKDVCGNEGAETSCDTTTPCSCDGPSRLAEVAWADGHDSDTE